MGTFSSLITGFLNSTQQLAATEQPSENKDLNKNPTIQGAAVILDQEDEEASLDTGLGTPPWFSAVQFN